jgi:hypothetical protein
MLISHGPPFDDPLTLYSPVKWDHAWSEDEALQDAMEAISLEELNWWPYLADTMRLSALKVVDAPKRMSVSCSSKW